MFTNRRAPQSRPTLALILATSAAAVLLAATSTAVQAYNLPPGAVPKQEGKSCPDGWKQLTFNRPAGQSGLAHFCAPPKDKASSSSSSSGSRSYSYVEPTKGSFPKSGPLQNCPSGYYSNNAGDQCITHWDDAPAVTAKKGACPAGTVEEWGAWCTAALKDTSDKTLDQLTGYKFRDFNNVYLAHQLARKPLPSSEVDPELLRQAKAERAAAGSPYKTASERDREAEKAKQLAQADKPADAPAEDPTTKDVKEAAKAMGTALKGLFGR